MGSVTQIRIRLAEEAQNILDQRIEAKEFSSYQDGINKAIVKLDKEREAFELKIASMDKTLAIICEMLAGGFAFSEIRLKESGSEELIKKAAERVEAKIRRNTTKKVEREKWQT